MSDFPAECLPQSPQCPADRASLPALSLLSLPHLMPVKLPLLLRSWVPAQHFELQQGSWGCLSLAQLGSHALITGAITEAQEMLGSDWPALVMCMTQSLGPGRRDASAAKETLPGSCVPQGVSSHSQAKTGAPVPFWKMKTDISRRVSFLDVPWISGGEEKEVWKTTREALETP
ncbi:lipopolysaccharide-induced tumor necrosis factor-alpha factor isoform X2 [Trachypithecus francoisi]|uniref:lipopolysaccharide-induced tumor necrosis factor-alpha factor isoform X2 n=1 Tax=Trachypithecus francoisi TaxID=54180 RepID=UPI00141B0D2C|nr:lipopolysaccharide-induced tumor necrosis factor-alpha factor isoform X2 [Trachypithecus francoisi]